jgi:kynurenine formamidase
MPFFFPDGEVSVDVYLGDSLPHTHAESLLVNRVTIEDEIPADMQWAVRDVSALPAAEWTSEASLIDLSYLPTDEAPTLDEVKRAARHVRRGDFVAWRTWNGKQRPPEGAPGIPMEVARWLVEDVGIVGIMADCPIDPVGNWGSVGAGAAGVHTYFYTHAVIMIDEATNFDRLDERFFLLGGLCLNTSGIASCPARPVAIIGGSDDLANGATVDMFEPMASKTGSTAASVVTRLEPYELQPYLQKRFEVYGIQIAGAPEEETARAVARGSGEDMRPCRDFGSPIRLFNSHLGTHVCLPHTVRTVPNLGVTAESIMEPGTAVLAGPALVVDLSGVGAGQIVSRELVAEKAADIRPGDIVVLFTGTTDRYYHRADYLDWNPRFDPEAISWLVERGAKLIVSDTTRLEPTDWRDHRPSETLPLLFSHGIPAVVGATNLWALRTARNFVYCSAVPMSGLTALPARLVAIEAW